MRSLASLVRESGPRATASLFLRRLDPVPAPATVARFLHTTAATWNVGIAAQELHEITDAELDRRIPSARSPLGRVLHYDLKNYLPALLHVEDRTSMAVSLESRVPLLDHRIVEIMARVPTALKFPDFRQKHLLRRVATPVVPAEIVGRKDKKGFPTPLGIWLREAHDDARLREAVSGTALRRIGILGGGPSAAPAGEEWTMLSLEMWARTFLEGERSAVSAESHARLVPAPAQTPAGSVAA